MLDKTGFKRKTYQDLKADLEAKFKEKFGNDINISAKSPFGILIMIFAFFLAPLWELAEMVYNSGYSSKAEGVQLDRLAANKTMSRDQESESHVELTFTGTPNTTIQEQTQFATDKLVYFYLIENVTLDETGKGSGEAVSLEKGIHTNVAAGTIKLQAEPTETVYTVTNLLAATGGRDVETDIELRDRLIKSPAIEGNTTINAIIARLNDTAGVRSSSVVSVNPVVHAYVLGGNREDVADTLFNCVAAGIDTVGSEEVTVLDISGTEHTVRFDYAKEVQIRIKIDVQSNTSFPSDGVSTIKQTLIQHIGGKDVLETDWTGLALGEKVVYSQLFNFVYDTPGIEDVTIQITKNNEVYQMSNLVLQSYEIARTSPELIEVNVS
ncbi:baseplate J/gp47 family protein [Priestia aryabhattai]|uniref:baseplate J/gp47 family protein n=1 Tax=Priestia aryabhattai TaxID=412384 RepID=UPI002E1D66EA|nr:baseplate J/gp47 family protein [Priestia aryabhattai]MED4257683.1 baseplate J/gp47 family protein [Priestia aryabhattai]